MIFFKNLIFQPFLIAFLISLISTPLTIRLAWKLKLVDDPKKRKHPAHLYQKIIPRAGGLPIFVALVICSLMFLPLDQHLKGILLGATILTITGLLDDRLDLNPYLRLVLCLLAAGSVVISGIGITFVTNPLGGIIKLDQPIILADIFALVWIVFLTNSLNWAKGFDGQLPGIVVIASLTIAFLSLRYSADVTQWPVAILAATTAGAYLGFLPYNFYPQKIMPGFSGGALAGFLLAVVAILSTTKVGTAIMVLGIPFIDAIYSISRRIISGHSPVWGDRGHLHHRLLDEWHWGKRKAAFFYWLMTALLGGLALNLNSRQKFYTMIMLAVLIGALLLWLNFFSTWSGRPGRDKRSKT